MLCLKDLTLRKLDHEIYIEFFSEAKTENFIGKNWIFLIILLQTLIVGTR